MFTSFFPFFSLFFILIKFSFGPWMQTSWYDYIICLVFGSKRSTNDERQKVCFIVISYVLLINYLFTLKTIEKLESMVLFFILHDMHTESCNPLLKRRGSYFPINIVPLRKSRSCRNVSELFFQETFVKHIQDLWFQSLDSVKTPISFFYREDF